MKLPLQAGAESTVKVRENGRGAGSKYSSLDRSIYMTLSTNNAF
jgi:hypothetical protein